ncbi:MAG TPA: hypothetical protein VHN12_13725 [Geobacteraceae bacterium]|jgi:hypothetical protein|nr:hypothetical protein [Geobacteraceae bacterium]
MVFDLASHPIDRNGQCANPDETIPSIPEETIMKILLVLTSHDELGNTGNKTTAPSPEWDSMATLSGDNTCYEHSFLTA